MKIRYLIIIILFCISNISLHAFYFWKEIGLLYNSDNTFELLTDYLGEDTMRNITDSNNCSAVFLFKYCLDGDLDEIFTIRGHKTMYFTEEEWENIFDFFHNLPPFELPNPEKYYLDPLGRKVYDKEKNHELSYDMLIKNSYMPQYFSISDGKSSQFDRPDSISIYDWNIKNSYRMPYYPYCYGSLDSIFGIMKWEEVKYRYNKAVELGTFKIQKAPREIIEASDYKREGYCWEKIPIKNYNINIQVPIGSKIKIANDTLSANITFPDSTYISIQFTKGLSSLKLTENETNPRQRRVSRVRVTKKMVSSWGEFEHDGKEVYWQRERYRYGVTLTLYASSWKKFSKYYKPIFGTATIVMRPKYKTIYLKD